MLNKGMINYQVIRSSTISENQVLDFLEVFNKVFDDNKDVSWFKWKYNDNIYGDSFIIIAYDDTIPIGIRSFWRNDIEGKECYQPCDTALFEDYRKMGIFPEMSRLALEETNEAYIYNFPNENSTRGNIKMGWEEYDTWYLSFCTSKDKLKKESSKIDDEYLNWRFSNNPNRNYYYIEYKGEFYLLYGRSKWMYYVLGRISKEQTHKFRKINMGLIFQYRNKESLTYKLLKRKSTIYVYNKKDKKVDFKIPMNKADFF